MRFERRREGAGGLEKRSQDEGMRGGEGGARGAAAAAVAGEEAEGTSYEDDDEAGVGLGRRGIWEGRGEDAGAGAAAAAAAAAGPSETVCPSSSAPDTLDRCAPAPDEEEEDEESDDVRILDEDDARRPAAGVVGVEVGLVVEGVGDGGVGEEDGRGGSGEAEVEEEAGGIICLWKREGRIQPSADRSTGTSEAGDDWARSEG